MTLHLLHLGFSWFATVGRANRRFELGLRTSDQIEILDGLSQGDLVVPVAAGVRAGQRIRPVTS